MEQLRSNVSFIIWSGFIVIIVLMMILSSVMYYKLIEQSDQFNNVVKINNAKVRIAHIMRDSVRLRSISLSKMALSDDVFYRDDERINYDIYANRLIRALNKFEQFDLNITEIELVDIIKKIAFAGYPVSQQASAMLQQEYEIEQVRPFIAEALVVQENILTMIDKLIAIQKSYAEQSLKTTENNMTNLLTLLLIVVLISILFSIIISQAVSRIVSLKNTELEKATQSKSMFLANMSHEIRTPLTAIIGFAKSQMIPNLPAQHNERATKIILRNSEHLLTVINDILDFSKIESQKLELEYTKFSLFNLMDDIQSSLTGLIGDKPLKFEIGYTYPLPEFIITDKTRLRQVLINIGGNAMKFTEQGYICINIHYNNLDDDIYFDISDSGIGMNQQQLDLVFQTFSQADISTTRKYGGTGLGLTISRELVAKLGGELTVRSDQGTGSTFSFKVNNRFEKFDTEVRLIEQPPGELHKTNNYITIENHHIVRGTVLVAEDMPDNRELFTLFLDEMGATVTTVNNGKEAIDITQTQTFDLVLMDMQMPVMGGVEAVKLIRERGDKFPIVMVTANASTEYEQASIDSGCDAYLSKPLNEQELLKIVKQFLTTINGNKNHNLKHDSANRTENTDITAKFDNHEDVIISTLTNKEQSHYNKIIVKFINQLPVYVDDIGNYIKRKDDDELTEVMHKLKGVGGNMGFKVLTDISSNFETAIKQGNRDEIHRLFNELKDAANKIYQGNDATVKLNHHT